MGSVDGRVAVPKTEKAPARPPTFRLSRVTIILNFVGYLLEKPHEDTRWDNGAQDR